MGIEARLLGPPMLTRDGVVYAAPRGKKVWALFAYLALNEQPPTRQHLADLLFPDAEDPANALRWNLSELRRLLGGPDTVGSGNTVGLRLPTGAVIDVHVLLAGTASAAVELPGLGRELLEGVHVEGSPGFAAWLLGERRRLQSIGGAVLREGALRALAVGNARAAVDLATRMVGCRAARAKTRMCSWYARSPRPATKRLCSGSSVPRLELFHREVGVDSAPSSTPPPHWMRIDRPSAPPSRVSVSGAAGIGRGGRRRGRGRVGIDELQAPPPRPRRRGACAGGRRRCSRWVPPSCTRRRT